MAWSSDGSLLASGAKDGSVFIWPTRANSGEDEIPGDWTPLGFSTDGRSLAAIHPSGTVSFFNLETRESERELPGKPVDAGPFGLAAAANPGLSVLTRADGPGALEILDLADGQRRVLRAARGRHRDLALSPDGRQLVAAMGNQRILWWDLGDPIELVAEWVGTEAVFSGDGRTLATLNPEGGLDVWDVKTRTRRQTHAAGPGSRWHPALSFDGRWFATTTGPGDSENLIHVRETATGRLHGVLAGHKQTPLAVAFAPDGRTLASSGHDSTLKLWNVASSQELLSFRRPGVFFSRLLFSPDGRWLVAGRGFGASGSMQLLHAPAGEETGTSSAAKATPAPPAPTATDDPASK